MDKSTKIPEDEVTENGLHPRVEAEIVRRINTPEDEWVHGRTADFREAVNRERVARTGSGPVSGRQ